MRLPLSTTFVSARKAKCGVRFLCALFALSVVLLGGMGFSSTEATTLRQGRALGPASIAISFDSSAERGACGRQSRVKASHKPRHGEERSSRVAATRRSEEPQVLRLHRNLPVPHVTRHRTPRPGPQRRLPAGREGPKQSAAASSIGISLFGAAPSVKTEGDSQLYKLHCTYWL